MTLELGEEMSIVHKFIRDNYAKRFPELESIVTSPVDYANAVKRIGTAPGHGPLHTNAIC
jgi:U4/U6 small nuclear ribonucleoprotein PRP31